MITVATTGIVSNQQPIDQTATQCRSSKPNEQNAAENFDHIIGITEVLYMYVSRIKYSIYNRYKYYIKVSNNN